jgi:hypothetical protein
VGGRERDRDESLCNDFLLGWCLDLLWHWDLCRSGLFFNSSPYLLKIPLVRDVHRPSCDSKRPCIEQYTQALTS